MRKPETYAEYLWRERTESGGEVDKTTIDQIPCDTKQTEERKLSDLKPEIDCDHLWLTKIGVGYRFKFVEICAKCEGEQ